MPDLVERDLEVLWHPATHFADHARVPPLPIASAKGAWLTTAHGTRILDAISSWWTCLHGHGHPAIVEAIRNQVDALDHVMLAGFTHEPAVRLAEALLAAAPGDYGKVFYADCGSASVEIALKLSFQHRVQSGAGERRRFATLRNAYHGETLGALAVSGNDAYRGVFAPLLFEPLELPVPHFPAHRHADLGDGRLGEDSEEAERAVTLLRAHAHELSALVVEPLVQCAGKMAMMGAGYLRRIVQTAQALGIHVIADEIAVAFGRTGRLFASTWAGISPDLLCLSKGLSGGVLPLSCVLIRRGFEAAFQGDPSRSFLHSHTFTGNPIACAAGFASLQLLQTQTLPPLDAAVERLRVAAQHVATQCSRVQNHRQCGTIVAFDVTTTAEREAQLGGRISLAIREAGLRKGVLLRPLHDAVYWMPPLNLAPAELDHLATATTEVLRDVL